MLDSYIPSFSTLLPPLNLFFLKKIHSAVTKQICFGFLCILNFAIPAKAWGTFLMGDVNGDGKINLIAFVSVVNHIQGIEYISNPEAILQADVNGDGLINSYDLEEAMKYRFNHPNAPKLPLGGVLSVSPYSGEADVSLGREFIVRFTMPLSDQVELSPQSFYATAGQNGETVFTAARLSSDRMRASLYLSGQRWPSSSQISVHLKGDDLVDVLGRQLDLDKDGVAGGDASWTFTTVSSISGDINTAVEGWVYDSDSSLGDVPLTGVVISIPGSEEELTAITDQNGYFRLSPAPIGTFFVTVDGRLVGADDTETLEDRKWVDRDYYTFVSKAWKCTAGRSNLATHYGDYDDTGAYIPDPRDGKIYLPLIKKGTLIEVNPTEETLITFGDGYLEEASDEVRSLLAATTLTIPPGALISDDGTVGGSIGIAPVSADRLPEPLPNGLNLPFVITIQTILHPIHYPV